MGEKIAETGLEILNMVYNRACLHASSQLSIEITLK